MAQNEIGQFDEVDNNNTDISGTTIVQGQMYPYMVDNAFRNLAGMLKRWFKTSLFRLRDSTDQTKLVAFDLSGLPTGVTRTWTAPYYSGTLGLVSDIRGQIFGLTLSNNVTDATNDIDIAAGSAVDSTGTRSMLLAAGITKRLDATWVAGTNQGGRFYTTLIDGWIYLYEIFNPTTGVTDVGFSDNASNPTGGASYPAGFSIYRYIGPIARVGGVIRQFRQNGDTFIWATPVVDLGSTIIGASSTTVAVSAPAGRVTTAILTGILAHATPGNGIYVRALNQDDVAVGGASVTATAQVAGLGLSWFKNVETNTSSQIAVRAGAATTTITVNCLGFIDNRNRF
jgi:hypothetical protein